MAGSGAAENPGPAREAREILAVSGVQGGLVVHLGCGDGELTAALRAGAAYLVQGLDASPERVATARGSLLQQGLYGPVTIDRLNGSRLPYIDNLVNLVVAETLGDIPLEEALRVLRPGGVVCIRQDGAWTKTVKPRPDEIDDWTHYLHSATNNAVSRDTVVGPPRRLQWVGSPLYSRHHDRMSSVSAVVSAGGRVFAIFDEATAASILVPPQWSLIARDAFNGTILWRREMGPWHPHLWPLKSGPAQLPRRLVASDRLVYVTLQLDGPVLALDAATGETVRTFEGTAATEEILLDGGTLFLLVDPEARTPEFPDLQTISKAVRQPFYPEDPRQIMAVNAETGKTLWTARHGVLPGTLAAAPSGVFFHDGQSVVRLDRRTGGEIWRSEPVDRQRELLSKFMPTLVVYEDVILFAGASGRGQLTALSVADGKMLWQGDHPPSGYQSPEDVLVAGGLVWSGETTTGSGIMTGRAPRTGEVAVEFPPDTDVFWFHHRCYRGKATENYLLMSRTGIEFVDFRRQKWLINHWVRGACLYGVMPANGLLYAPQHPCACYLETKLSGFNALAPAQDGPRVPGEIAKAPRLEKGPAYEEISNSRFQISDSANDWPTFRADGGRSGRIQTEVAPDLTERWQAALGGKLTAPTIGGGRLFVARTDTHTLHALDAASGRLEWSFTAGGVIDSPPTLDGPRVLFGSADGWVYCLRAADGELAWRFRAAPMDQRLVAFEELQSVWPVHGSVLLQGGAVWFVAGRSVFLDGGLRLCRLDPATGQMLSETVLDDRDPATNADRHDYVSWLNMPAGLPDILSTDGRHVYMRSQAFDLDGKPRPLEVFPRAGEGHGGSSFAPPPNQDAAFAHLFSPTGFLDDSSWHRTYWLYGSRFYSGWSAYYLAGRVVPAGRILVFDDSQVYGFGRKPQYYRWTTPIEHQLFAADKTMPPPMTELPSQQARRVKAGAANVPSISRVQVPKTEGLSPAGKPLTVEAWIYADGPDGVVFSHGGHAQGYALYLRQGRPHFTIRVKDQVDTVAAEQEATGRWRHLAGVLTADKGLELYLDGKRVAAGAAPALIPRQPQEGIEIGADSASPITDFQGPAQFPGRIDEVRLYHRAISASELAARATGKTAADGETVGLVLAYDFEDGKATDLSGLGHHGIVEKATPAEGRSGRALQFAGPASSVAAAPSLVQHRWTVDLPLTVRALALAGEVLFLAGPPDLVDEELAAQTMGDPQTQAALVEYAAALEGRRGGLLWAVSARDGRQLAALEMDTTPVFDGMAAGGGNLYLATVDGRVICFGR